MWRRDKEDWAYRFEFASRRSVPVGRARLLAWRAGALDPQRGGVLETNSQFSAPLRLGQKKLKNQPAGLVGTDFKFGLGSILRYQPSFFSKYS